MLASKYPQLMEAIGGDISKEELTQMFVRLLKDPEAEVRVVATGALSQALAQGLEFGENVLKAMTPLVTDEAQSVRETLASDILLLIPFCDDTTRDPVFRMFQALLKDAVPGVRLNVISKLGKITDTIGEEKLSQDLIPAIVELSGDKHWRVRLAVIEYIPPLAKQLTLKYFSEHLGKLCLKWLRDSVSKIREKAATLLKLLVDVYGSEFLRQTVLPQIREIATERNYLYRMVSLFIMNELISVTDKTIVADCFFPILTPLLSDPIPNVRINVAKTLRLLLEDSKANEYSAKVTGMLKTLAGDSDVDVLKMANLGLKSCK